MDCIPEESSERDEGPDCDRVVPSEEENSEFSSAPSLSRQCTEFSDVVAQDLMSRQLSDFAARQGDFWIRKCSEPVPFNGAKGLDSTQGDFRRQSSCPPMMRSEGLFKEPIQELEIEPDLEEEEEDDLVSRAICAAVGDCDFSVAVADPTSLDTELIAVSEGFEQLTGYTKEEAVGENCRFLSDGCELPDSVAEGLRKASESGAPYKSLLVNKRKTGEFFLNLLSIRGLVLARNTNTGEEIWILVSVQQDVTGIKPELLPSSNDALLMKVASRILRRLLKYATEIGIACLIQANGKGRSTASNHFQGGMHLLSDIAWKDGESLGLPPQKVLESLPQAFAHLAPPEPHEPVEPPSSGVGSKMLIWPLVFSSMTVAVMVLLLQRKRQKATFSSPVASSQKLSIKQVSITRLVSDVAVQLCYGVRLNMEVPEPEFITALTTHFPEAGFVTKLPSSRPGSEFLALVQRVHQGVSLQVTDCQQGLFRHCLDAPKLRQLREDAGMADQDGCTTVVSADGVSGSKLRLELRFQLQSAALLARLEMEAAATMPAVPPEAQHFLEELRGFVLSALSTSMSSSTSAGSRAAPVTPPVASPPRSISAPAALGQVSSPEPRADVLPRPAPAKKRAPGSLVDPHRKARRGGGAKPFQLSET
eukprot:symbB.v1.2.029653.t1/scaffold3275.1/size59885/5